MEMVFQGLPALLKEDALPGSAPDVAKVYYALTPRDCQCLAVRCCGVANLMDRERQTVAEQADTKCLCLFPKKTQGAAFKQEMLEDAALEARSQQAGAALELYYRLAEAEAGYDLLEATLAEVDDAVARARELRKSQLLIDEEWEKLLRQRTKVLTDRTELVMNIERLNVELGKLICIRACPGEAHFWPLVDLDSTCPEINVDGAVEVALASRGELKALRAVNRDLSLLTLPAARETMRSIHGLLASADPKAKVPELQVLAEMCCQEGPYSTELKGRRDQMAMRIAERQEAVASDVRAEARQVYRRCQTATLAMERIASLARMVREVEDRYNKSKLATLADVTKARLEWLQGRADVVKEIAARERAKAKLKQHQGVLPLECLDPEPVTEPAAGCCTKQCGK
jgi:hypothetical protein